MLPLVLDICVVPHFSAWVWPWGKDRALSGAVELTCWWEPLGVDKLTWIDEFKSQRAKFPHSITADLLREPITNIVSLAFSPDRILPYFRNWKLDQTLFFLFWLNDVWFLEENVVILLHMLFYTFTTLGTLKLKPHFYIYVVYIIYVCVEKHTFFVWLEERIWHLGNYQ